MKKNIHFFSYIIGSWTLNNWINMHHKNNIKIISVIHCGHAGGDTFSQETNL